MIIKITAFIIGLIAIVLTFKAELILEKVFKKEPTQGLVLRVKYIALALAVIAFMAVFIKLKGVSINGRCKEYSKKL